VKVLGAFGILLDVFKFVGGIIIAYMGFKMLGGRQTFSQAPPSRGPQATPAVRSLKALVEA
jgi:small neutral amino acid transporter SnatA (MarC family)